MKKDRIRKTLWVVRLGEFWRFDFPSFWELPVEDCVGRVHLMQQCPTPRELLCLCFLFIMLYNHIQWTCSVSLLSCEAKEPRKLKRKGMGAGQRKRKGKKSRSTKNKRGEGPNNHHSTTLTLLCRQSLPISSLSKRSPSTSGTQLQCLSEAKGPSALPKIHHPI
jgi:hypothetical protein